MYERVYSIIVLVFALIVFSSFVSSITSAMNQLKQMGSDNRKQMWLLRRYLTQRHIPHMLATCIHRYVEYQEKRHTGFVQESQVKLLSCLSDRLRNELQRVACVPHIKV